MTRAATDARQPGPVDQGEPRRPTGRPDPVGSVGATQATRPRTARTRCDSTWACSWPAKGDAAGCRTSSAEGGHAAPLGAARAGRDRPSAPAGRPRARTEVTPAVTHHDGEVLAAHRSTSRPTPSRRGRAPPRRPGPRGRPGAAALSEYDVALVLDPVDQHRRRVGVDAQAAVLDAGPRSGHVAPLGWAVTIGIERAARATDAAAGPTVQHGGTTGPATGDGQAPSGHRHRPGRRCRTPRPTPAGATRCRSADLLQLAPQVLDLVAQAGGVLEAQVGGRLVHLLLERAG